MNQKEAYVLWGQCLAPAYKQLMQTWWTKLESTTMTLATTYGKDELELKAGATQEEYGVSEV